MALSVVLWSISGVRRTSAMAVPVLVAAVLCLQLVLLPDNVLVRVSPVSAGAWKVAKEGTDSTWSPLSVDPATSLIAIRRLLLGLATLVAVADMGRYQSHRRRLTAALAISGLLILALGFAFGHAKGERYLLLRFIPLAGPIYKHVNPIIMPVESSGAGLPQEVTAAGHRYVMDAGNVGDGFGPYIYSNHFAGAMVLTIPVAISAWLFLTHRRLAEPARLAGCIALGGATIMAVGVMAKSRGGLAALVVALLGLAMLVVRGSLARRLVTSAFLMTGAGIALLACLLTSGGDHTWITEMLPGSMQPQMRAILNDTRTIPAQVAMRMFAASPMVGTGLNTYQFIFPRFYRGDFTLFYAHSDYAQFLAETGLVGLVLLSYASLILIRKLRRFQADAPIPYRLLAAGPWAALLGFLVHSAFDWNLHLPANALLAILAVGLALASVPADSARHDAGPIPQSVAKCALVACCTLATVFLGRDSAAEYAQRGLRAAIVADRIAESKVQRSDAREALNAAILAGRKMAAWDPWNAQLATWISNACLHGAERADGEADRDSMLASADEWATRARHLAATPRGLSMPLAK